MDKKQLGGDEIRALVKEYCDRTSLTVVREEEIEDKLYNAVTKLIGKAEREGWDYFKKKYHIQFQEYSSDRIYRVEIGTSSFDVYYWCYLDCSCQDGFEVSLDDVARWADGDFTEERVEGVKVRIAHLKSRIAECERVIETNQDKLECLKEEFIKYQKLLSRGVAPDDVAKSGAFLVKAVEDRR